MAAQEDVLWCPAAGLFASPGGQLADCLRLQVGIAIRAARFASL